MSICDSTNIPGESSGSQHLLQETRAGTKPTGPDSPYVFKHAPPKPDGDPWEILLKPELEADTARCDAWKEEVQNLLIFAGLFSAVVTAFVIESYKFLQQDPNDAVIGLLFVIAKSLNTTSPLPPSVNPTSLTTPFSQTSSSIRINIFWFLSLILSLTTVLVGTISLQWLREHQSYPGFSAKEKLAILHMRLEALDVWYVPQIFAVLPVLLQGALILFLAGLIDFALPLGPKLTTPVSVIIGLTLLFLAATTVLPAFQGFLFLTGLYPYSKPPTPCAFKSPQSRVLLAIFALPIHALSLIIFWIYRKLHLDLSTTSIFRRYAALPYLQNVLRRKTWRNLDREWLALRDAYCQYILDKEPDLYYHQLKWRNSFPLSDIAQCLVKIAKENPTAKHTEVFLGAAVHCFQELSASIWTSPQTMDAYTSQCKDRRSNYFTQLYQQSSSSLANYFLHGGVYKYDYIHSCDIRTYLEPTITLHLFHWDQIFSFLALLLERHGSSTLFQYNIELRSQIISQSSQLTPLIVSQSRLGDSVTSIGVLDKIGAVYYNELFGENERYAAVADTLAAIFKSAASYHISQDRPMDSLYTHSHMAKVLKELASLTADYLRWTQNNTSNTSNQMCQPDVGAQFGSIFKFVAGHLNEEMPKKDTPSVLFYMSLIFMWKLLHCLAALEALHDTNSNIGQGLRSFLEVLLQYRTWARTSDHKNNVLEARFVGQYDMDRFSDEWWDHLFEYGRKIGLKATKKGMTVSAKGISSNSRPNILSQEVNGRGNTAGIVVTLASPSEVDDHSPVPNGTHNEVSRANPQPVPRILRAVPNLSDDQDDDMIRLLSDSLVIANSTAATNDFLDPMHTATLSHSQPSFTNPHTPSIPNGSIALKAPLPSQLPASFGTVGTAPKHARVGIIDDEHARIQHAEPRSTIEVNSPVETAEMADSSGGVLQD